MLGGATVKQLIELSGQHLSIRAIARRLDISRNTVRKYLRAPRLPVAKPRPRRPSKVDPFRDHVRRRLAAGVENCLVLLRELIQVDRALARTLELAGLAPVCAGEGALLMPEELGLEQALRDRGAVNLDEWTTTARRDGMDGSGHQALPTPLSPRIKTVVSVSAILAMTVPMTRIWGASVEEWTLACGIGPLHTHESRFAEEDLNSRACPRAPRTVATAPRGLRRAYRPCPREPEDRLQPPGRSAPLHGKFPAPGGRPSEFSPRCRPSYERRARLRRPPWAGRQGSRAARRKTYPRPAIPARGQAPREENRRIADAWPSRSPRHATACSRLV